MCQLERSGYYVDYVPDIGEFMLLPDEEKLAYMLSKDNMKINQILIKDERYYISQIRLEFLYIYVYISCFE